MRCVCRHVLPTGSSPSPREKPLWSREEETIGGVSVVPGCGWGSTREGCSAATYSSLLRGAGAAGGSHSSCPVHKPEQEPSLGAGGLPVRKGTLGNAKNPPAVLQLVSMARVSLRPEEESGGKNAGVTAGTGHTVQGPSASLAALQRARHPSDPGPAERGWVKVANGFPRAAGEKLLGTS